MPGYGFSGEPTELGWDAGRIAQAWAELMRRLGYTRYVAQGGDVGAAVTDAMGRQAPEGLLGIHINLLVTALAGVSDLPPDDPRRNARRSTQLATFRHERLRLLPRAGHPAADDRLRPAGLTRRPGGLDARPRHRQLLQDLRRLRRRAALGQSHPRPHPRQHHAVLADRHRGLGGPVVLGERTSPGRAPRPARLRRQVSLPVGFTTFPGEIFRAPRSWVEPGYPNVIYFNEADRGGHFAAWEEPELFSDGAPRGVQVAALKGDPHDAPLSTPEGHGSVSGAPNLPEGFADTFTSRFVDVGDAAPARGHRR